jgi:hypothetical protein
MAGDHNTVSFKAAPEGLVAFHSYAIALIALHMACGR